MFDHDQHEQANISGADFAQMVDELKAAKQRELELLAVIKHLNNDIDNLMNVGYGVIGSFGRARSVHVSALKELLDNMAEERRKK